MSFPGHSDIRKRAPDPVAMSLEVSYRLLGAPGRGLLLAVSGGADSTALLIATAQVADRLELTAHVACVDHGLRPEARREVLAVRRLAARFGFAFHTRRLYLKPGPGVEERARLARYAALEALRRSAGLDFVVTAHTASDQAETLLMRLARGAALRGAAAILPRAGAVIRPLLSVDRAAVERFLALERVPFSSDPMNRDAALLRTRVRRGALPSLEAAAGPGVARRLAGFAALALEDEAVLAELADDALARLRMPAGGLDAVGLRALAPALRRRVLVRLLEGERLAVDHDLVARSLQALDRSGSATLPRGCTLRCAGGLVRVVAAPAAGRASAGLRALELDGPGVLDPPSGLVLRASSARGTSALFAAAGRARLPFAVRHRQAGDRVGARRLQDVLVDQRVPEEERDRVPVVCDARGEVVWVVGVWPDRPRRTVGDRPVYLTADLSPAAQARGWLLRYRLAGYSRPNTGGRPGVTGRSRKGQ